MAVRTVATTDTLEIFRTTFNSLSSTDIGDLASLNTTTKSSVIAAINEVEASVAGGFTLRDSTSTTQAIEGGATLNVVGSSNEVTAVVSATDTLTIGLASSVSGLTSMSATTLTDGTASMNSGALTGITNITGSGTLNMTTDVQVNGVSVSSKAFAIAQAVALG